MTWKIALEGHDFDLQHLHEIVTGPRLTVEREEETYCLAAEDFANASTPDEVRDIAGALIGPLNGIAKMTNGDFRCVSLGSTVFKEEGPQFRRIFATEVIQIRMAAVISVQDENGNEIPGSACPNCGDWIEVVRIDPEVSVVLDLYGQEPTWVRLYAVLDALEWALGDRNLITSLGWATGAELDRFTATANSFGVIGKEARHGPTGHKVPKRVMTFDAARELIGRLVAKFVNSRMSAQS